MTAGAAPHFDPVRSCIRKNRYDDERAALATAAKCFDARGTLLRAYACDVAGCGGWHLTKTAVPAPKPGWRPPAKSQRAIAEERRRDRRRR